MKIIRVILMVAITMVLTITLIVKIRTDNEEETQHLQLQREPTSLQPKKVNRFLAEYKNPRAADHCNKDNQICFLQGGSATSGYNYNNSTCCNNKCVDLAMDNQNCGACKNKCEYTEACCRGKCVNLAYDKRHCGSCNNRCDRGLLCIYGMCDYP